MLDFTEFDGFDNEMEKRLLGIYTDKLEINNSADLSDVIDFEFYREVSDIDMGTDGSFGIEWEYEDGFRVWDWFKTEQERLEVLNKHNEERIEAEKKWKEEICGRTITVVEF